MPQCKKEIVLPPHASKSDVCSKDAGHVEAGDPVHQGEYRGVKWMDSDEKRVNMIVSFSLPESMAKTLQRVFANRGIAATITEIV